MSLMPCLRSIVPAVAKSAHGVPPTASSAISRASMVATKMRRRHGAPRAAAGSSHADTPREVAMAIRRFGSSSGSNIQRRAPVSASSAITRLYGVLRNSVPSTISGVASNAMCAYGGAPPGSPVR